MKTNLNRTITTVDEAKAFLRDLHTNNEVFHPETEVPCPNGVEFTVEDEEDKVEEVEEGY